MAMVLCHECKKKISDNAAACPHCGAPPLSSDEKAQRELEKKLASIGTFSSSTKPVATDQNAKGFETLIGVVCVTFVIVLGVSMCDSPTSSDAVEADGSASEQKADAVSAAFQLCAVVNSTGLATGCEVEGFGNKVNVTMDMVSSEARKSCYGIAAQMEGKGFGTAQNPWTLRILSPYSGDEPIATCRLR